LPAHGCAGSAGKRGDRSLPDKKSIWVQQPRADLNFGQHNPETEKTGQEGPLCVRSAARSPLREWPARSHRSLSPSPLQPLGPLASLSAVRFRSRPEPPPAPGTESEQRALKNLASRLAKLRVSLERLSTSSILARNLKTAAQVLSSSSIGLDFTRTATTLESTEEVNTTPTSFSPFGPSFSGTSTSLPTIGGTYDGAQADDTLTFKAQDNFNNPDTKKARIQVYDGLGTLIDTLDFQNVAADTPLTLSNGLTLSLSTGSVVKNETFQVSVFATLGSSVDPDKPFNGTRNNDPNLESGLSVSAGSFEVNGITINVLDTDTINTLLSKITSSAAGVTATFDSGTETVLLTQKTLGSQSQVVLANDTSGFLASTKLNGATQILGKDPDDAELISTVSALSGISTGNFSINGVSISVDTSIDSLNDVIDRINSSAAGVTATFSESQDKLDIKSNSPSADLVLSNGSSGFFSGVNITPGTFKPKAGVDPSKARTFEAPDTVRRRLLEVGRELDALFQDKFKGISNEVVEDLRGQLRDSISAAFESILEDTERSTLRSGFGIAFSFSDTAQGIFDFDLRKFNRSVSEKFNQLTNFLFRDELYLQPGGLIPSLIGKLKDLEADIADTLGAASTGLVVDVMA